MQQNAPGRSSDLLLLKFGASGLPVWPSQTVALWMPECSRSSQQRACSGITPDSLFTALAFRLGQHQMHGKGNAFCASIAPKQSLKHFMQCCNVWIYSVLCVFLAHVFVIIMEAIFTPYYSYFYYILQQNGVGLESFSGGIISKILCCCLCKLFVINQIQLLLSCKTASLRCFYNMQSFYRQCFTVCR